MGTSGLEGQGLEGGRVERAEEGPPVAISVQQTWAGWPGLGGVWPGRGTNGTLFGTSGKREIRGFWLGIAAIAVLVGAFNTVNVMSDLHDVPQFPVFDPVVWESSSWVTFVTFAPIIWLASLWAPLSVRPRWRLALHVPAAFAFSLAHVVGFMLIRKGAYWLVGSHYSPSLLGNFFYEFRKDLLGYGLSLLAFHWAAGHTAVSAEASAGTAPFFDIRDGARLIRVPMTEILAVTSAGNYVEFVLADGRRPLMRMPLSALEAELSPSGFVRTHRSWLVNAARVTGLAPEGSGDYRVELGRERVPLSRRYRAARAQLRGEAD